MDRMIEWYCHPDLLEDLQGDLHEYYARNIKKGKLKADLIFLLDVMKFCRLYTIQKPKILGQMTVFNLLGNYFKTTVRSLARNKLFSAINIVGLAISMSIGLLMIAYLIELSSFDDFHTKKDRIYRVISSYQQLSNDPFELASSSIFIGDKLIGNYPGIEKVLTVRRHFREDLQKGDNIISVSGLYSTEEFFDVFSFDLIHGDPKTALQEPGSVVLTNKTSKKLFDEENPIGQTITSGDDTYTVTGVMEDVPSNSHIGFEALCSMATLYKLHSQEENSRFFDWGSIWIDHVYVLLEEDKNPQDLKLALDEIAAFENESRERFTITFDIQNLSAIAPGKDLSNQIGRNITWSNIIQLGVLTLIIILAACFNYTNLSIARALRRAKEVGVRKIVGASRGHVMFQFIFEAVIISLIACVFAFGLYLVIKPAFISMVVDGEGVLLEFDWKQVAYFFLFAVVIGFVAGVLPSMVISKLKAISILGDMSKLKILKGVSLRKVLIVLQFAVSMVLIITATITYRQYQFSLNYDLGFNTDNVLNVEVLGNDIDLLENELSKIPDVKLISRSGMIPSSGEIWGEEIKYKDPLDSVSVYVNWVNQSYADIHQLTFLAGGTFPYEKNLEAPKFIIIDERMRKQLGFATPGEAVGEVLTITRGREEDYKVQVSGVIENYQYVSLTNDDGEPSALIQAIDEHVLYLNLLVNTQNMVGLIDRLEGVWSDIDPVHTFQAEFLNQRIEAHYAHYKVLFGIFTFLGLIAIAISAMGLLGIAVFTTETRMKEISVRKVLGATERNLMLILSRSFLLMLAVSGLLALPFSYFVMKDLILDEFSKRISVGVLELLPGVFIIFFIGLLTIAWQTLRTAKTNPAEMLRTE